MRLFSCLVLSLFLCMPVALHAAPTQISATVFPVWLLLRQVAGHVPGVNVRLVLPAGTGCPHDYALTPSDRKALAETDILIINGLGLESFLGQDDRISQLLKPGAAIVDASRDVRGLLHDKDTGAHHAKGTGERQAQDRINPHIFASPSMMAEMAISMGKQLALLDVANAGLYQSNAKACQARMNALARECEASGARLAQAHIVAEHSIFSYLARDMQLSVDAFIQTHEGIDPSARDLLELARLMRKCGTAAVITEPQYPGRSGKTLAKEAGIPCIELDPAASGPENAPEDYYEQVMRRNIRLLEQHLGNS